MDCTKQHETKSSARGHDAIKRDSKHEMDEFAARVTQHTLYSKLFLISGKSESEIMIDCIV